MAKLVYGLNVSLDGYADHTLFAPDPVLFRHFTDDVGSIAGSIYGRKMYEIMRYWDEDDPHHSDDERAFALAWRSRPKWVVSRTLKSLGPNAFLIEGDLATAVRDVKERHEGDIQVAGPVLAGSLTDLGLIDEYRMYLHPVVVGGGKPFFTGPRPPLHLVESERIGPEVIRLNYVPAPAA